MTPPILPPLGSHPYITKAAQWAVNTTGLAMRHVALRMCGVDVPPDGAAVAQRWIQQQGDTWPARWGLRVLTAISTGLGEPIYPHELYSPPELLAIAEHCLSDELSDIVRTAGPAWAKPAMVVIDIEKPHPPMPIYSGWHQREVSPSPPWMMISDCNVLEPPSSGEFCWGKTADTQQLERSAFSLVSRHLGSTEAALGVYLDFAEYMATLPEQWALTAEQVGRIIYRAATRHG